METTSLVSTRAAKHYHFYTDAAANSAGAVFPRSIVEDSIMLFEEVIVFATSFKKGAVFIYRVHYFGVS